MNDISSEILEALQENDLAMLAIRAMKQAYTEEELATPEGAENPRSNDHDSNSKYPEGNGNHGETILQRLYGRNGGGVSMRIFYHYTAIFHLPAILEAGYLKLTESNLRADVEMYKPVVWLTTEKEPDPDKLGLSGSIVDKTEIRIHVEKKPNIPITAWEHFSKQNKIDPKWKAALEQGQKPETWYISTSKIPLSNVLLIENRYTGHIYYKQGDEKTWPKAAAGTVWRKAT